MKKHPGKVLDEGIIEEIRRKIPIEGGLARVYLKKTCHNTHKNLKARVERSKKARYTQRLRIVWAYRKKEAGNVLSSVEVGYRKQMTEKTPRKS